MGMLVTGSIISPRIFISTSIAASLPWCIQHISHLGCSDHSPARLFGNACVTTT